jgi:hypothetical protein
LSVKGVKSGSEIGYSKKDNVTTNVTKFDLFEGERFDAMCCVDSSASPSPILRWSEHSKAYKNSSSLAYYRFDVKSDKEKICQELSFIASRGHNDFEWTCIAEYDIKGLDPKEHYEFLKNKSRTISFDIECKFNLL